MELYGPFEIDLRVQVINDNGDIGEITYSLPSGQFPTKERIELAIEEALTTLPKKTGLRAMNRQEFQQNLLFKRTGSTEKFVFPGGDDWDTVNKEKNDETKKL